MNTDEVCDLVQIDLARVRKIRAELVAPEAVQGLAETFSALGDPTRVRILDALSHGELCVCDLAAVLSLSQSAVSHQLRLLRNIRLVKPAPRRTHRVLFARRPAHHVDLQADAAARGRRAAAAGVAEARAGAEGAMTVRTQRRGALPGAHRLQSLRNRHAGADRGARARMVHRASRRSSRSPAVPLAWSWLRPGG